jgi:hypothetical protein
MLSIFTKPETEVYPVLAVAIELYLNVVNADVDVILDPTILAKVDQLVPL